MKKISFFTLVLALSLFLLSCEKEAELALPADDTTEETDTTKEDELVLPDSTEKEIDTTIRLEDGIYVGEFSNFGLAYSVSGDSVIPLGHAFPVSEIYVIDSKIFTIKFPENYSPRVSTCFKTPLKISDYDTAFLNSDKEFLGLHYAHNNSDITGADGKNLIFAIKQQGESFSITISKTDGSDIIYRTTGSIYNVTTHSPEYRRLIFEVSSEITNAQDEVWCMTLNPITNYSWSNLFNLYKVADGNVGSSYRFQIEVMDNGIK